MFDYMIVGAGLFGATFAHKAIQAGKSVIVVEKRNHIGGNIFTECIDGIQLHKYGSHIFHTNDQKVWNYVNGLAKFNHYINSPVANFHGNARFCTENSG